MEPDAPGGPDAPEGAPVAPVASPEGPEAGRPWQPGIPSLREHLPSLVWGAALPIGVYFLVRRHVHTDTNALIVAGCFSAGWIVVQFARQRKVDVVGAVVLFGFAVGVVSSTLLGGNAYVLKVRDAFFTTLFGVACIVTVFTHERPTLFYVARYLSAGTDRVKVSAFDRLYLLPVARHTFRVLSVVWGVGLIIEASVRLTLADVLSTATYLAASPVVTASVIGGLFAFTALYTRRIRAEAAAVMAEMAPGAAPATAPAGGGLPADSPPPRGRR
jgi:hypothetical protein